MKVGHRLLAGILFLSAMLSQTAIAQTADPTPAERMPGEQARIQAVLDQAYSGNANAEYALAVLYEKGQAGGTPADAQFWYQKAATQGQAGAKAWMADHQAQLLNDIATSMVAIDDHFMMAKFDVTQDQWTMVMGTNPSHFAQCGYDCPVESVSWNDVQLFIQKLNQLTGQHYRLPTQSEWELACGMQTPYCGGTNLDQVGWYASNSSQQTQPVGQKKATASGLYDMTGNVWQWTSDCYRNNCSRHIARGGSWNQPAAFLRADMPTEGLVSNRNYSLGFRLAMDTTPSFSHDAKTPVPDPELQAIEDEMMTVDGKFRISRFDVTQAQWQQIMHYNPSAFADCPDCPVEEVSWNEVRYFIHALNERTGRNYRLPTREEWVQASGLQTGTESADNIYAQAWNAENSARHTHPVGKKLPNRYGLFDMVGNVKQWTADCFNQNCEGRVILGSSWQDNVQNMQRNQFGYNFLRVYLHASTVGFRLVEGL